MDHGVRDLGSLANATRILLFVQAGWSALTAGTRMVYGHRTVELDEGSLLLVTMLLPLLLFIGTGIAVLRWIYLANANVHALGAQGLGASPAWAVGAYFVPIVNLVVPFQSMREIWKASTQPRDWEIVSAPASIGLWWAAWIVSNLLYGIAFQIDLQMGLPAGVGLAVPGSLIIVSDILTIAASLLLAAIIADVTEKQRAMGRGAVFG